MDHSMRLKKHLHHPSTRDHCSINCSYRGRLPPHPLLQADPFPGDGIGSCDMQSHVAAGLSAQACTSLHPFQASYLTITSDSRVIARDGTWSPTLDACQVFHVERPCQAFSSLDEHTPEIDQPRAPF